MPPPSKKIQLGSTVIGSNQTSTSLNNESPKKLQPVSSGSLSTQSSTLSNRPVEDKPWNTKAIEGKTTRGEVDINSIFNNIVKVLLASYKAKYKQTPEQVATEQADSVNPHIYIGLKKNDDLLFGDIIKNPPQVDGFVIDNTPYNRNFINKSKLYIMSIISNYKTGDSSLHKLINAEISKGANFDLQKIVKILGMPPIIPVKAPVKPLRPVISSENMLELQIYKEFGVKCTTNKECYNDIANKFYKLNKNENENEITKASRDLIRNFYVTIFDYITGSDDLISTFGNKDAAYNTCMNKALNALKELNKELHDFIGARTMIDFNIKKLIIGINSIRKKINESLYITLDKYIPEI
jgi:hypothetical protein